MNNLNKVLLVVRGAPEANKNAAGPHKTRTGETEVVGGKRVNYPQLFGAHYDANNFKGNRDADEEFSKRYGEDQYGRPLHQEKGWRAAAVDHTLKHTVGTILGGFKDAGEAKDHMKQFKGSRDNLQFFAPSGHPVTTSQLQHAIRLNDRYKVIPAKPVRKNA